VYNSPTSKTQNCRRQQIQRLSLRGNSSGKNSNLCLFWKVDGCSDEEGEAKKEQTDRHVPWARSDTLKTEVALNELSSTSSSPCDTGYSATHKIPIVMENGCSSPSPQMDPILSQLNPVLILLIYFSNIPFSSCFVSKIYSWWYRLYSNVSKKWIRLKL
jgi:hypothetical protein